MNLNGHTSRRPHHYLREFLGFGDRLVRKKVRTQVSTFASMKITPLGRGCRYGRVWGVHVEIKSPACKWNVKKMWDV